MINCKNLTFEECELFILRQSVDKIEKIIKREKVKSPEIKRIINIVETFIKKKKVLCYGGTAINNLLPKHERFYDKRIELPDYDFFSKTPIKHAKELADIYFKNGYTEVEAKAGIHSGTFKVFVNFIPIADISYFPEKLFNKIWKKRKTIDGISYLPPNFLRLLMYLELSRPKGHIQRWEKVLKRLTKLNRVYPIKIRRCDIFKKKTRYFSIEVGDIIIDTVIRNEGVFFGSYANKEYLDINKKLKQKYNIFKIRYFDILSEEPKVLAKKIKDNLKNNKFKNIKIKKISGIGEIISQHYKIMCNNKIVCFIYKPLGCHSYNIIQRNGRKIKIATIDTLLMYYLMFMYIEKPYYNVNNILCMAEYLFRIQGENRLKQKGLLKRFTINCIGKQETFESLRLKKSNLYNKLKKGTKEWDFYFLKYIPTSNIIKSKRSKTLKKSNTLKNKNISKNKSKKVAGKINKSTNKRKKNNNKTKRKQKTQKIREGWLNKIGY